MKKLIIIIAICLSCFGFVEAQDNIWKPINAPGYILAVAPNGYLYSTSFEEGFLWRSMDEGLNWELVFYNSYIYSGTDMAVSQEGRVFVVPNYSDNVYYSDDNGGTWHTSARFPTCWVEGMYAVSNDTLFIWGDNDYGYESLHFTLDGGQTWSSADINPMGQTHHIGDVIANEAGDVFVSFWSTNGQDDGIYRSDFTDLEQWTWELAAFPNVGIRDLEFNPEGEVVAVAFRGEYNGFQHVEGFTLAGSMATSLGIADDGTVYICRQHGNHSVLAYSSDRGAHFHEIGENLAATGGTLFKGTDNHLYFFSESSHWKSFDEAGAINTNYSTFAKQGAEWYFNLPSFMGSDVSYYHMEVLGETLVQGHQCSIISPQFLGETDYQYVYEDNRKVYWYNPTLDTFTTLYDFDAEVGDSWICEVGDCSYEIRVRSIDDILYEGHTYRVQNVVVVEGDLFYYDEGHIIDGLGSMEGLFPYPSVCDGTAYDGPYPDILRCYLVDGEEFYHQGNYACTAVYPYNTTCWDGSVADAYEGGDGTEENPYQIATPQQLALLAQQTIDGTGSEHYYILVDDICLNDEGGTLEWPMIGGDVPQSLPRYFEGVFDGNGHTIKGMYISQYHVNSGLFGGTDGAVIKNLTVDGSRILDGNGMGILAGHAQNTDVFNCCVTNCELTNSIASGGGGLFGSVAAYHTSDTVVIRNCVSSNVRVGDSAAFDMCGGIVGYAHGTLGVVVIEGCVNYSDMVGDPRAGGILGGGGDGIFIRDCMNYGTITAEQCGGGIVGYCWDAEITRCFNWGDVWSGIRAGGIAGQVSGHRIFECANYGSVSSASTTGSQLGGLVGINGEGVIANCYNRGEVSAVYAEPGRATEALGGIVGSSTGSIYNVYNAGRVIGPELPSGFGTVGYGAVIGHTNVEDRYLNCYWLEQDDMPACGNANLPDLLGSSPFNEGTDFNEWVLSEPQYGTDDLLVGLNRGVPSVLDSIPDYPFECAWQKDEYGINGGLPMLEFQRTPLLPFVQSEWFYKIRYQNGGVAYQHLECAGDTTVHNKDVQIIIRTNTLYDKSGKAGVTHEYVYEEGGIVYWWNRDLHQFTTLYNLMAEEGDSWQIRVGTQSINMHVDAVDSLDYYGRTFRVLHVSDANNLFSGDIVCGIGHQTSFFPEQLMRNVEGMRVDGLRCYWLDDRLVYKNGDEDCDAIYSEIHGIEEDSPAAPSADSGTFVVYPNPTNGVLNVSVRLSQCDSPTADYRICNIMGQTVLTGSLNAESQRIDVSALPEGMYFITVGDMTKKFVVNR